VMEVAELSEKETARGAKAACTIDVAVVGATGYAGFELATLLLRHPQVGKATFYLRDGHADVRCLTEIYPQLRGRGDAPCAAFSVEAIAESGADVVFLSTPHEASLKLVPELLAANPKLRIVDLSGAFRFRDGEVFSKWYKLEAPVEEALRQAVYGLPELYSQDLASARIVANPGCYPTSVILGLGPLVKAGWIDESRGIVCDCKSGVSGAGKEPKAETHFVSVSENFRAYGLFTHRHTPEVQEHLGLKAENFIFTTHLLPVARGILSTLYLWLDGPRQASEIEALYRKAYAHGAMVRILPAGTLPELSGVTHTNFCDIGFALDQTGERLVVVACLDNLGKGAAGQAIQNMNAMFGFEETSGLI
jgi:N-acetyl-gamma-glutamyl-phosphate reductase